MSLYIELKDLQNCWGLDILHCKFRIAANWHEPVLGKMIVDGTIHQDACIIDILQGHG